MNPIVFLYSFLALICGTFSVAVGGRPFQFVIAGLAYLLLGYVAARGDSRDMVVRQSIVALAPWLAVVGAAAVMYRLDYLYPIVLVAPLSFALGFVGRKVVPPSRGEVTRAVVAIVFVGMLIIGGYLGLPQWWSYLGRFGY